MLVCKNSFSTKAMCKNYLTISGNSENVQRVKDILIDEVGGLFDALIGKVVDQTYDVTIDRDVTFLSDYLDPVLKITFDTVFEAPANFINKVAEDYNVNVSLLYYYYGKETRVPLGNTLFGNATEYADGTFIFECVKFQDLYRKDEQFFWDDFNSRVWRCLTSGDDNDLSELINQVSAFVSDDDIKKVVEYKDDIVFINNLLK
jgi:hypothetical protein